jgi:ABC-2 type transport system permease protein
MRRLLSLTSTLLRDWIRNREAVFFAVLFPLLLLIIFSFVFAGGPTEFEIGIQNNDMNATGQPTELSATLVAAIEDTQPIDAEAIDPELSLADTERIEEVTGQTRVLIIPDGFDQQVRAASTRVRMTVIRDTINRFRDNISDDQNQEINESFQAFESSQQSGSGAADIHFLTVPGDEGAGAVGSILDSIVATFNDRSIGVEEPSAAVRIEERGRADLDAADYFLPGFIVAMILINGVMTVPSAVAQFKRDGTLKRLAASPLRKREWIVANVVQQSILAVAITLVLIAVARLLFGVTAIPGPLALGLIVLGAVAFTALGMIVAGAIRDPGSAVSLGGAIALPLMFVSGIFWELDLMPPALQTIAEFSPVTHFHRSLRQLLIVGTTDGVGFTAVVLALLAGVFLVGAVLTTSWREFD